MTTQIILHKALDLNLAIQSRWFQCGLKENPHDLELSIIFSTLVYKKKQFHHFPKVDKVAGIAQFHADLQLPDGIFHCLISRSH